MSETRAIIKAYCAHPVQKEVNDGSGARVITAKCTKPMSRTMRVIKNFVPGGNGAFVESIEHGLFCEDGHRAGKR